MSKGPAALRLMLLALATSWSGCASTLPPPNPPIDPAAGLPLPAPDLMTPPKPGLWSESARQLFRRWQRLLTPAKDV